MSSRCLSDIQTLAIVPNFNNIFYCDSLELMDHSPINQNFELNKSRQKFHYSLKEHHKISNIPMFRCKML